MSTLSPTSIRSLPLDQFRQHIAPTLDAFLAKHTNASEAQGLNKTQVINDAFAYLHGNYTPTQFAAGPPRQRLAEDKPLSCITAAIEASLGAVGLLVQIIMAGVKFFDDLSDAIAESIGETLGEAPSDQVRYSIVLLVKEIGAANGAIDKASATIKLVVKTFQICSISTIIEAVKHRMKFYDWIIIGLIVLCQLTALVATDGLAEAAELAGIIMGAVSFGVVVHKAVEAC